MKYALITGCSSGIGKESAKEVYSRGYTVFAGARRVDKMQDLASMGIHVLSLDVTSQDSIDKFFEFVKENTNKLDLLFNNAGQSCTFPASDVEIEDAKQCFDVNLYGAMRMVKTFLPMLIQGKGTIAFTGSVTGELQFPFSTVYSSSKAALHQYANGLRLEVKPFDVKVVTVCTAGVDTGIADTRPLPENSLYTKIEHGVQERRQMAAKNKPMDPRLFAQKVINQVERKHPKPFFWQGNNWLLLWIARYLLPRWLVDYIFMKKFKLLEL